jgi:glucose-6-phosphate dehydrogenase assembly protein OpcA
LEAAVNIDLPNTKSAAVLTALTDARHRSGTAALGMVLTLVVDVNEVDHHDVLRAATCAAREHPCRIVTVIRRTASSPARLDAEIHVGEEGSLAEVIVLRLYGELRNHADSVVLPMLLPDAPVLVWWPGQGPPVPSEDPLGLLAQRRVTDAAAGGKPLAALEARSSRHSPGDTDLAWTRLTPWRTLLAAALDQPFDPIVGAEVGAARNNPSAELLATWLEMRLDVPVLRKVTRGPGITSAQLLTKRGEITITRPDGRLATLVRTGQPDRAVALPRRTTEELLAEELRRLDPYDVYNETIQRVFGGNAPPAKGTDTGAASRRAQRQLEAVETARSSLAASKAQPVGGAASSTATVRRSTTARAMQAKAPLPRAKQESTAKAPAKSSAATSTGRRTAPKKTTGKKSSR